jgi:hypothetical protein
MLHTKITKDGNSANSNEPPRKRVARACDRCRLKKGKCDGKEQCAKCVSADVMCIYTDRKPPQHKLISPAVAEALQSENLTLKKATIIIFKQLMEARNGKLPEIEGVDWESEKVANGKSGRALNHIITQEARVDNRISNEEITNYDSDTQMLDSSNLRSCPDSPHSHQSSPMSSTLDVSTMYLDGPAFEQPQQTTLPKGQHRHKKRKSTGYEFSDFTETVVTTASMSLPQTPVAPYMDNGMLQPPPLVRLDFSYPPTPPMGMDPLNYASGSTPIDDGQIQWSGEPQNMNQTRFFHDGSFVLQEQRYSEDNHRESAQLSCHAEESMSVSPYPWATGGSEYYPC